MRLARIRPAAVVDHVFASLAAARGGWIITANLDFLRRFALDPEMRALYDRADLRVADGMPLIWASWLQGDALPERVPGSALIWTLAGRAAESGRSLYLLGGDRGTALGAKHELLRRWPALRIVGTSEPRVSSPPTPDEIAKLRAEVTAAAPDLLLVGFGSPKQEQAIAALRSELPGAWMVGVGISFSFIAGRLKRAPRWVQALGLEWVHRLWQEPGRLARRYLIDDVPFAFRLLGHALRVRYRRMTTGARS
ncbi:MAG TPA: WecB/TagA/CpsF family glycosyltransferase [Myxococcota bacterium]|nr:WecB/TagA/CpsF family glycosyltransferase [Myxococcota bacterium]